MGFLALGPGSIPGSCGDFLDPILYGGISHSALMRGAGKACSCLNLICQALLTPNEKFYHLRGVDEGWVGGGRCGEEWERGEGRRNCDWYIE